VVRKRRDLGPIYPRHVTVGVDLGQAADSTALAVLETQKTVQCFRYEGSSAIHEKLEAVEHRLRDCERLPLGLSYPLQAEYLRSRLRGLPGGTDGKVDLVVDATGLGKPILDILEAAGLQPIGVVITGGMEESQSGGRLWRVPKELLVNRVSASLHIGELVFPDDLEDVGGLKRELQDFQVSYTAAGHLTFAARPGAHDDRVLALAVATWWAQRWGRGSNHIQSAPLLGL
jgi:hypothetical protein